MVYVRSESAIRFRATVARNGFINDVWSESKSV